MLDFVPVWCALFIQKKNNINSYNWILVTLEGLFLLFLIRLINDYGFNFENGSV